MHRGERVAVVEDVRRRTDDRALGVSLRPFRTGRLPGLVVRPGLGTLVAGLGAGVHIRTVAGLHADLQSTSGRGFGWTGLTIPAVTTGFQPSAPGYVAVGGPNQRLSASSSPSDVSWPTQATYPSGRTSTAVGASTVP